ncbi:MAG: redoxin domain-containing protein [Haliscomenobacter sp.]|nr:redoxin domain-containing protein [Haliscomenobacter sp.]
MKSFLLTAWMVILMSGFTSLNAQDLAKLGIDTSFLVPKGLEVGQKAPDFEGQDQYGQSVSLDSLLKEGPVVLIFTGATGARCATGIWAVFRTRST